MIDASYDQFIGKVMNLGGSLAVIIPKKQVQFSGLKVEQWVKIYYKKVEKEDDKNVNNNTKEVEVSNMSSDTKEDAKL